VVLVLWQRKAPIDFALIPVHIDHGFWRETPEGRAPDLALAEPLRAFGLSLEIRPERVLAEERTCFLCARNRRSQLFDLAKDTGCNKLALGHHRDDLIETFLLNALYSGNISTMVPSQDLFAGGLTLLRPLAYLDKEEVQRLATDFGLAPVKNYCRLAEDTRRERVRKILQYIYHLEPGAKGSLFAALANVRQEYLL
jgi:tRNA 2-thiocytidine biosynthesis protein TtcA